MFLLDSWTRNLIAVIVTILLVLLTVVLAGCSRPPQQEAPLEPPLSAMEPTDTVAAEPGEAGDVETAEEPEGTQTAPARPETAGEEDKKTIVRIETERGDIVAELFDETMPITAGNFLLLVDEGFYDGLTFHRVEPGFVIQGGDPHGDGSGGPGFSIPLETNPQVAHDRGILSMARTMDPDSAGSQFFICLGGPDSVGHLDPGPGNPGYAAFGRVIEGMDVVDAIRIGDRMVKVTIESESPYADAAREAARQARVPD